MYHPHYIRPRSTTLTAAHDPLFLSQDCPCDGNSTGPLGTLDLIAESPPPSTSGPTKEITKYLKGLGLYGAFPVPQQIYSPHDSPRTRDYKIRQVVEPVLGHLPFTDRSDLLSILAAIRVTVWSEGHIAPKDAQAILNQMRNDWVKNSNRQRNAVAKRISQLVEPGSAGTPWVEGIHDVSPTREVTAVGASDGDACTVRSHLRDKATEVVQGGETEHVDIRDTRAKVVASRSTPGCSLARNHGHSSRVPDSSMQISSSTQICGSIQICGSMQLCATTDLWQITSL
ncbi:hypothetical protein HOY82DRAFT_595325 [Tuber indicum]|nr:hypothetical protein HOY82DRAFT_595325 [Tuber indicum]